MPGKLFRLIWRLVLVLVLLCLLAAGGFRIAAALREDQTIAEARPETGRMIVTSMGRIHVQEVGPADGPVILLAHGTAAWSALWGETAQALAAQGYRAIAFDMPPFGFSDRAADGDYARPVQAQRILALIRAMDLRPILVAHSFGAAPATEAVMLAPDEFAGFVMIDGAVGLGSHEVPKTLPLLLRYGPVRQVAVSMTGTNPLLTRRLLASLLHVKEGARPRYVTILQRPMVLQGSTRAFSDWLPSLLVPPTDALSTRAENYAALGLPVQLIWGDKDSVTPLAQGIELAKLLDQGPLNVLQDVGHIPQIEAPEAFQALLLSVLARMGAAG